MMEKAITSLLEQVTENVYPNALPEDPPTPCIVYQLTSHMNERSHEGPTGLFKATFRLAVFHEGYETLKETVTTLTDLLDGYSGTLEDTIIDVIFVESVVDGYEDQVVIPLYRTTVEIKVLGRDANYES